MEEALGGEVLRDQLRSDDPPVLRHERTVRLMRKRELSHRPYDQWVNAASDHEQHDRDADGDQEMFFHASLNAWSSRSMSLMPMNGMITPPTP